MVVLIKEEQTMKKQFLIPAACIVLFAAACAGGPKFSAVSGKNWQLIQVQVNSKNIGFDRTVLVSEGFGDIFTLTFAEDRLSGTGAPNKYFAPYKLGGKQEITIQPVGGTLMMPIHEPEKLKEHDFFTYLNKVNKWDLVNGDLHLSGKTEDGSDVTMIFTPENTKQKK
jgi:heat shock protein HslJ